MGEQKCNKDNMPTFSRSELQIQSRLIIMGANEEETMVWTGQAIISVHKMYVEGLGGGLGDDRGTWEYLLFLQDSARAAVTCS